METILTSDTTFKKNTSAQLAMVFIICFAGNMFAGIVSTLMSVYLPVKAA